MRFWNGSDRGNDTERIINGDSHRRRLASYFHVIRPFCDRGNAIHYAGDTGQDRYTSDSKAYYPFSRTQVQASLKGFTFPKKLFTFQGKVVNVVGAHLNMTRGRFKGLHIIFRIA